MFLFRRLHQRAVLIGLLVLTVPLLAACDGNTATAEDTSTTTAPPTIQPQPTGTSSVPQLTPSATSTDDGVTPDGSSAANSTATELNQDATGQATNQSDAGSLPGLDGYIDDRSGPVEVLQSLYSAINLKQYARAYSYWESSDQLTPFSEFAEGYANTEYVALTTGDVSTDVGAGQLYFAVPVKLEVTSADGTGLTFAGCYILHLARPEMQVEPPYAPMAIATAEISEVSTEADATAMMADGCP